MRPILVTHIMKTGGTSLRRMLIDAVGAEKVYPNDADLAARKHGFYPGSVEFLEHLRTGRTHGATIFIGHFPFVLREELDTVPITAAILREPIERTHSILKHRKLKSPRVAGASYEELLDNADFVDRQIRDYQTKVFAFESIEQCPETVDIAFEIDVQGFSRAVKRLRDVDVLGVTEGFPDFCRRFTDVTGIELKQRRDNMSGDGDALREREIALMHELTRRDHRLYHEAAALAL